MMGPGVNTSNNSRRTFAFIVVVVVHVLLIWGINAGLTDIIAEKVLGNLQTVEIAAPEEEEEKPPPPPPKMEAPPPFVPPPDISIELPPAETTTAIQVVTNTRPVEAPPAPVVERKVVEVPPSFRRQPGTTDEFYPPASKRAGEEGSIIVAVHVLESGEIDNIEVKESSGFPRLDAGAVTYVKTWRLKPGTRDGKPVAVTWRIRVTFKLKS